MTPFDLTALSAALPPETQIIIVPLAGGRQELRIGNPIMVEVADDASQFPETRSITHYTGRVGADGTHETANVDQRMWPESVTSPEEMLAFTFWLVSYQRKVGGPAFMAAKNAGALPDWKPGMEVPS